MINVSITQLLEAIEEADVFKLPGMSIGTDYIYSNIYNRLTRDIDVKLSDIDFDKFELEDVDSMRDFYSDILEADEYKANTLVWTLQDIPPVVASAAFV